MFIALCGQIKCVFQVCGCLCVYKPEMALPSINVDREMPTLGLFRGKSWYFSADIVRFNGRLTSYSSKFAFGNALVLLSVAANLMPWHYSL